MSSYNEYFAEEVFQDPDSGLEHDHSGWHRCKACFLEQRRQIMDLYVARRQELNSKVIQSLRKTS